MSRLPLEELHLNVQGTPVKTSTPLKEYNILGLESPLSTLNTPCRDLYALQESPILYTTPVRGSNLSSIEPRTLEKSFSDLFFFFDTVS